MLRFPKPRLLSLAIVAMLLLALLPTAALADTPAAPQPGTQQSGVIPAGGWVAFGFPYAGDFTKQGVFLNYSPSDDPQDANLSNGAAVTLTVYDPNNAPPSGTILASAGGNFGEKYWEAESGLAGTYTLIVNNWDSLGRPVSFTLSTVSVGSLSDPHQAPAGAVLSFISSASGVMLGGQPAASPAPAPAPAAAPAPAQTTQVLSALGGTLQANGGWAAYSFPYAGDSSKVAVVLTYSPSDDPQDANVANGLAVTMEAYSPTSLPPNGTPMANAGGNAGQKVWQLISDQAGTYVVLVQNWDSMGRPVQYQVRTVAVQTDNDLVNDPAGPALTLVSASGQ